MPNLNGLFIRRRVDSSNRFRNGWHMHDWMIVRLVLFFLAFGGFLAVAFVVGMRGQRRKPAEIERRRQRPARDEGQRLRGMTGRMGQ